MIIESETLGRVDISDEFDSEDDVCVHAYYGPISKMGVYISREQVTQLRNHLNKLLNDVDSTPR